MMTTDTAAASVTRVPWLGQVLLVMLCYWAAARLGLRFSHLGHITLLWLPSGIAVAALWRWGERMTLGIALGVVLTLLTNAVLRPDTWPIVIGNTLAPVLAVRLLRQLRFAPEFNARHHVPTLFAAAAGGMVVSACIGVWALRSGGVLRDEQLLGAALRWWVGDVVGVMLAAPPLLMLRRRALREHPLARMGLAERVLALALAWSAAAVVFLSPSVNVIANAWLYGPLAFLPFLPIAWLAVRSARPLLPALGVMALAAIATLGTAARLGPLGEFVSPEVALSVLWAYLVVMQLVALVIGALASEVAQTTERLHGLYESNRDAVLLASPSGPIHAANRAAQTMFGRSEEALKKCSRRELLDFSDPRTLEAVHTRERVGHVDAVLRGRRADGSCFDAEVRSSEFEDSDGRHHLFVHLRDVTQRERAAALLSASEARFRCLANAAPVMIWQADAAGRRGFFNPVWLSLVDLTLDAQMQQGWQTLLHPEDREAATRAFDEAVRAAAPYESQYRLRGGDGRFRVLLERGMPLMVGTRYDGHIGTCIDITERQRVEDSLRESEARLLMALEGGCVALWEWGLMDDELSWHDPSLTLFDQPLGRLRLAGAVLERVHPEDRDRLSAAMRDAVRQRTRLVAEFRFQREPTSERHVLLTGRLVMDAQRRVLRVTGTALDVTERWRAAEATVRAEAALSASRAKTEFLSRMSHELRTPLNAILGFTQLLVATVGRADPQRQRTQLEHIEGAGWHLLAMIDEVLDLSRIEAGHLHLELQDLALPEAVSQALAMAEPMAGKLQVRLESEVPAERAAVRADPVRLRQVLNNLLSNALKYNRPGGWVRVGARLDGAHWVLSVADSGLGMDSAQLAHLFEPFNRLGRTETSIEGTGIGLVISRRLVQAMGGDVSVRSTPGEGTLFEFTLPAAAMAQPVAPGRLGAARAPGVAGEGTHEGAPAGGTASALAGGLAAAHSGGLPGALTGRAAPGRLAARVLYVDDNPINALIVEDTLAVAGLDVRVAHNGAAGLAAAREWLPQIIVLNLDLPDEHGLELRRKLLEDPLLADVPCIAITARGADGGGTQARVWRLSALIAKPIDGPHLSATVLRALARVNATDVTRSAALAH